MNCSQKDELINILNDNLADIKHPVHVTQLAEKLFDELKPLHNLLGNEKDLLLYAAMLHDTGFLISVKGHHKHSADFILNLEIPGINANDKIIIANIARYHRKSLPSTKHEMYKNLSDDDKKVVSSLAAIMRIADGLDRTHLSLIKDIKVKIEDNTVVINYLSSRRFLPEEEAALKKSDLFEQIFNKRVIIDWQKI